MKKVLFLRKKTNGENSIEELAKTLLNGIPDLELAIFPGYCNSITGMVHNILFAIKHQGDINHFMDIASCFVAPFIKGKKIVTHHDMGTLFKTRNRIFRWIKKNLMYPLSLHFVDVIVCITNFTKTETLHTYPNIAKKTRVIYNSYNKSIKYAEHTFKENYPTILHIGTAKRKNLLQVIKALQNIPCKLNIVGNLNNEQLEALNENKIDYIQEQDIPFERIIELYKECDLVTFPSFYEGFGMPVIEAQVTGRPIIITKLASLPEIAGDSACFVDPNDYRSIRNEILKIIHNKSHREQIIVDGIANAKRFSTDKMIESYKSLYASLSQNQQYKK